MTQELKPCPFCGAEAVLTDHEPHDHSPALVALTGVPAKHPGSWTVECVACSCGMIHGAREEAIAAWNRRAPVIADTAGAKPGQWVHCSPALLNAGVSCANTPRRACSCSPDNGGHDHFIAHDASPAIDAAPEKSQDHGFESVWNRARCMDETPKAVARFIWDAARAALSAPRHIEAPENPQATSYEDHRAEMERLTRESKEMTCLDKWAREKADNSQAVALSERERDLALLAAYAEGSKSPEIANASRRVRAALPAPVSMSAEQSAAPMAEPCELFNGLDWMPRAKRIIEQFDGATAEPLTAMANFGSCAIDLLRAMIAAPYQARAALPAPTSMSAEPSGDFEKDLWSLVDEARQWEAAYRDSGTLYESLDSYKTAVETSVKHIVNRYASPAIDAAPDNSQAVALSERERERSSGIAKELRRLERFPNEFNQTERRVVLKLAADQLDRAALSAPVSMSAEHRCVGCEGKPSAENSPCAVCGMTAENRPAQDGAAAIARKSLYYLEGNLPDGPTDQAEFEAHKAALRAIASQSASKEKQS
jgi:hypothetical protein